MYLSNVFHFQSPLSFIKIDDTTSVNARVQRPLVNMWPQYSEDVMPQAFKTDFTAPWARNRTSPSRGVKLKNGRSPATKLGDMLDGIVKTALTGHAMESGIPTMAIWSSL